MGTSVVRPLTEGEIKGVTNASKTIGSAGSSSGTGTGKFVFFGAFDGTNNDRNNLPLANDNQSSSIGQIQRQVPQIKGQQSSEYYQGIGTGDIGGGKLSAGPFPTAALVATAEKALGDFAAQAKVFLQDNPNATVADLTASVVGFSRGCGTAVVFAQLLNERGLVVDGVVIAAPGTVNVSSMGLLDPVYTGINREMTIPENVTGSIVVVQAQDELRSQFKAADYSGDPRVNRLCRQISQRY
jgi:Uncharacterized alpha/beta hydrolase domain (DUF2235)